MSKHFFGAYISFSRFAKMDRESLTPVATSQFYTGAVSSIANMLSSPQLFTSTTNERDGKDVLNNNNTSTSGTPSIVSLPSPPVFELTEEVTQLDIRKVRVFNFLAIPTAHSKATFAV